MRVVRAVCVCLVFISTFATENREGLLAQKVYSPEHPEVRAMLDNALRYLNASEPEGFSEAILFGAAAYKAALRSAPSEAEARKDPLVVEALGWVDRVFAAGDYRRRPEFTANYAPAIILIFLLDIDADGYRPQIQSMLDMMLRNQQRSGAWGYLQTPDHGDTSQMQYVGLALWLADKSGYEVPNEVGKRALEWMIQTQGSSGAWIYTIPPIARSSPSATQERLSLAASGAGTVYVLAEWLQLATKQSAESRQAREMAQIAFDLQLRLPPSVTEYNPDRPEEVGGQAKVAFDIAKLRESMARSNNYFNSNFRPDPDDFTYYYLYAFERYASLRELVDGDVGRNFEDWYDQGVRFLKRTQNSNGSWAPAPGLNTTRQNSTALAVLFLTRSMQLSLKMKVEATMVANEGFPGGDLEERRGGGIVGQDIQRDMNDLLVLLDGQSDEDVRQRAIDALEKMDFSSDGASRTAQLAKLRELLKEKDGDIRLAVVKLIGKVRNLDNVPGLIFALTDPDERVGKAANDGLRFISRKVDSFDVSPQPTPGELREIKPKWIEWYLSIRPDGRLIEEPENEK